MKIKKIIAGVAAGALAVSSLATGAFAAELPTLDMGTTRTDSGTWYNYTLTFSTKISGDTIDAGVDFAGKTIGVNLKQGIGLSALLDGTATDAIKQDDPNVLVSGSVKFNVDDGGNPKKSATVTKTFEDLDFRVNAAAKATPIAELKYADNDATAPEGMKNGSIEIEFTFTVSGANVGVLLAKYANGAVTGVKTDGTVSDLGKLNNACKEGVASVDNFIALEVTGDNDKLFGDAAKVTTADLKSVAVQSAEWSNTITEYPAVNAITDFVFTKEMTGSMKDQLNNGGHLIVTLYNAPKQGNVTIMALYNNDRYTYTGVSESINEYGETVVKIPIPAGVTETGYPIVTLTVNSSWTTDGPYPYPDSENKWKDYGGYDENTLYVKSIGFDSDVPAADEPIITESVTTTEEPDVSVNNGDNTDNNASNGDTNVGGNGSTNNGSTNTNGNPNTGVALAIVPAAIAAAGVVISKKRK